MQNIHLCVRGLYQEGYELAEKDLALSWEDVMMIVEIADDIIIKTSRQEMAKKGDKEYYEEVLGRFNETKNK